MRYHLLISLQISNTLKLNERLKIWRAEIQFSLAGGIFDHMTCMQASIFDGL